MTKMTIYFLFTPSHPAIVLRPLARHDLFHHPPHPHPHPHPFLSLLYTIITYTLCSQAAIFKRILKYLFIYPSKTKNSKPAQQCGQAANVPRLLHIRVKCITEDSIPRGCLWLDSNIPLEINTSNDYIIKIKMFIINYYVFNQYNGP